MNGSDLRERLRTLHERITGHGRLFAAVLYVSLFAFTAVSVFGGLKAVLAGRLLSAAVAVFGLAVAGWLFAAEDLFSLLFVVFLFPAAVIVYLLVPYSGFSAAVGPFPVLVTVSMAAGVLAALVFDAVSGDGLRYVVAAVGGSSLFAAFFSLDRALQVGLRRMAVSLAEKGAVEASVERLVAGTPDIGVLFAVGLVCFNLPFLVVWLRRYEKRYRYGLLYAVPVAIYLVLPRLLVWLVS
ncbi:MAG: hypothetical protein SV186_00810 [Candidatus Nanohaloarchaea archaeon]|nr:hypothetical protein [Candidatus Nanohaloarchaea archaeon]